MTVAAREERILTRVFGATLSHSMFRWTDRQRTAVEAEQDAIRQIVPAAVVLNPEGSVGGDEQR